MSAERTECRTAIAWLQSRLDGERGPMSKSAEAHVARCADCRGRIAAAERLLSALPRSVAPPPRLTAERAIVAIRNESRRERTRWLTIAAGLAAALLLAGWLGFTLTRSGRTANDAVAHKEATVPTLRQQFAAAGEAVVGAGKRAANETIGESRLLIPPIDLPKTTSWAMAAATLPIDGAGRSVADGLAPVTTSARRAMNLLMGESKEKTN